MIGKLTGKDCITEGAFTAAEVFPTVKIPAQNKGTLSPEEIREFLDDNFGMLAMAIGGETGIADALQRKEAATQTIANLIMGLQQRDEVSIGDVVNSVKNESQLIGEAIGKWYEQFMKENEKLNELLTHTTHEREKINEQFRKVFRLMHAAVFLSVGFQKHTAHTFTGEGDVTKQFDAIEGVLSNLHEIVRQTRNIIRSHIDKFRGGRSGNQQTWLDDNAGLQKNSEEELTALTQAKTFPWEDETPQS